jgi:hypothetical protein
MLQLIGIMNFVINKDIHKKNLVTSLDTSHPIAA